MRMLLLNLDILQHLIFVAVVAITWSDVLAEELCDYWGKLQAKIGETACKPLGTCLPCFAGQLGFWSSIYLYWDIAIFNISFEFAQWPVVNYCLPCLLDFAVVIVFVTACSIAIGRTYTKWLYR